MAKKKDKRRKKHKKSSFFMFLLLIFLTGGIVGGYYAADYITRNDMFEVNGEKVIYLDLGDEYVEEKASAIAFGKKIENDKFIIEGNVDTTQPGKYVIKYTVDHFRYKKVARYRIVFVSEPEESSQTETLSHVANLGGATWGR